MKKLIQKHFTAISSKHFTTTISKIIEQFTLDKNDSKNTIRKECNVQIANIINNNYGVPPLIVVAVLIVIAIFAWR